MKVNIEDLTKAEKKHLISQFTLVELFEELHRRAKEDEGAEFKKEEGEDFKFQSPKEADLALSLLRSRYPHEAVRFFCEGMSSLPLWLQEEILEMRVKKDV